MAQWYAVRSFYALACFVTIVAALAIQAELGVNPLLAFADVAFAALITFPFAAPIVYVLRQLPLLPTTSTTNLPTTPALRNNVGGRRSRR